MTANSADSDAEDAFGAEVIHGLAYRARRLDRLEGHDGSGGSMSFLRGLVFSLAIVVLATLGLAGGRWSGMLPGPPGGTVVDVVTPDDRVVCEKIEAMPVEALNERVVDLYAQGDADCARELAIRALDEARANLNDGDPALIDALNNLARLETEAENWDGGSYIIRRGRRFLCRHGSRRRHSSG